MPNAPKLFTFVRKAISANRNYLEATTSSRESTAVVMKCTTFQSLSFVERFPFSKDPGLADFFIC